MSVCEVVAVVTVSKSEYVLHGLGQIFHLLLTPDTVTVPHTPPTHLLLTPDTDTVPHTNSTTPGGAACYYSGYVRGVQGSSVGVSICGGLVSTFLLSEKKNLIINYSLVPWTILGQRSPQMQNVALGW